MTQSIQLLDDNRKVLGLPPKSIQTITANELIDDSDGVLYKAIEPTSDVTAYFTNNTAGTATLSSGSVVLVHQDLRLSADTSCWVY